MSRQPTVQKTVDTVLVAGDDEDSGVIVARRKNPALTTGERRMQEWVRLQRRERLLLIELETVRAEMEALALVLSREESPR